MDDNQEKMWARAGEQLRAARRMLETLKLVEGQYAERGIELKDITRAIATAEAAGLQVPGNDDERGPMRGDDPPHPTTKEYAVTLRREAYAYTHITVQAADVDAAIRLARTEVDNEPNQFNYDYEATGAVDWAHAELGQGEDEPDGDADVHADWEAPALRPSVLVKALNDLSGKLGALADADNDDQEMHIRSDMQDIIDKALAEAIPGGEDLDAEYETPERMGWVGKDGRP